MKTSDLIALLAEDGRSPTIRLDRVVALSFLGGVIIITAVFAAAVGVRSDFGEAIWTTRVVFKMGVVIALALAGAGLLMRVGRPTARLKPWVLLVGIVAGSFVAGAAVELAVVPPAEWLKNLNGTNRLLCLTAIPAFSIVPLAAAFAGLRNGAPRDPAFAGAGAGLAAAAIGATLYALNCNNDSPLFVATWYPIAIGIVALAGAAIGRRLLRW